MVYRIINRHNILTAIAALASACILYVGVKTLASNIRPYGDFHFEDFKNNDDFSSAVDRICQADQITIRDTDRIFRDIAGAQRSYDPYKQDGSYPPGSYPSGRQNNVIYAYPSLSNGEYIIDVVHDSALKVVDCSAASHGEPGKMLDEQ